MTKLRRSIDAGPPRDLRTEERFLSAFLLTHGRRSHGVVGWHFHDCWHRWLFLAAQKHRGRDVISRVYAEAEDVEFAIRFARLFVSRDGRSRSGLVRNIGKYAKRLRGVAQRRKRYEQGYRLLVDSLQDPRIGAW